jgi:hypothetical protein
MSVRKRMTMLSEPTACAVKGVLGFRNGEIALSDAVLSVEELADDAVGTLGRCTVGGERELAGADQRDVNVGGWEANSPKRLGWDAGLGHGGQGSKAESGKHGESDGS